MTKEEMNKTSNDEDALFVTMCAADTEEGSETATIVKETTTVDLPHKWKVLLHNDNTTPMDFVLLVLEKIFKKTVDEAVELMMYVHNTGKKSVINVYPKSIAQAKIQMTQRLASESGHNDFTVTMEKE